MAAVAMSTEKSVLEDAAVRVLCLHPFFVYIQERTQGFFQVSYFPSNSVTRSALVMGGEGRKFFLVKNLLERRKMPLPEGENTN